MSHIKKKACAVLPGTGTRLGVVAGAMEVLTTVIDFIAFAGTSGGGLVALAYAMGMTPAEVSALCSRMLQRKDLLDSVSPLDFFNPNNVTDPQVALFKGKVVQKLLREVFETRRMGGLKYPCRLGVASLWTGKVALVDSVLHKDVLCWRAGYATMAIEGAFNPIRLREDNARTYADGGTGLNVAAGAWDDREEKTVVVRFTEQQRVHTLDSLLTAANGDSDYMVSNPVRDKLSFVAASFGVMMGAASATFPSRKTDVVEVILTSDADGLAFGIPATECDRRRQHGVTSAKAQLGVLA